MNPEPQWIDKKALLLLHEESIATFGGARGLREEGLLDSALARPRNLQVYRPECTLAELAASYGFGLAKNHPFIDGNKRVAFLAAGLFLAINGQHLMASEVDAIRAVQALAAGEMDEATWSAWISRNAIPL